MFKGFAVTILLLLNMESSFGAGFNSGINAHLSPAMQALVNKNFLLIFEGHQVSTSTNCWNTTIELLRQRAVGDQPNILPYALYQPDQRWADDLLNRNTYSQKIKPWLADKDDVLLIYNKNHQLLHTAILISKDYVFEKVGPTDMDPYLVSPIYEVMEKYKKQTSSTAIFILRRFNQENLPLFKSDSTPTGEYTNYCDYILGLCATSHIRYLNITIDPTTGKGQLQGDNDVLNQFIPINSQKKSAPEEAPISI